MYDTLNNYPPNSARQSIIGICFLIFSTLFISACGGTMNIKNIFNAEDEITVKDIEFSEVYWFAQRAKGAYATEQQIKTDFPQTILVKTLTDIDVQYFVEEFNERKLQVISVRGTSNFKNALQDIEYMQVNDNELGIFVHKGFNHTAIKVYADLQSILKKDYQIAVTGHSLGAAIATLVMMHLHSDGYELSPSINFGQPKVTNHKGVSRFKTLPVMRVVNKEDVVPMVPPVTVLDSVHGIYQHLGEEIILLPDSYFVYQDQHDASRLSIGSFWRNLGHERVEDHYMDQYLTNIEPKLIRAEQISYADREQFVTN